MHRVGVTALALSLVTGLGGVAAASAADGHHVYPSKQQVHDARHRVGRCPCLSGDTYDACCGPIHRGEVDAPTAERLMRSRLLVRGL